MDGLPWQANYSSFAFIVIFAFSTFETGHPFSAASAYFWKVGASAPGTFPTTSMWLAVIVQPESSFSIVRVTFVEMLSGVGSPFPTALREPWKNIPHGRPQSVPQDLFRERFRI